MSFLEARGMVRELNLKNRAEYRKYEADNPEFFSKNKIAKTPEKVYKDKGWVSFRNCDEK